MYDLPTDALEKQDQASIDGECYPYTEGGDTFSPALYIQSGETVYDYVWYPAMVTLEPASCVFASTSRVRLLSNLHDPCCESVKVTGAL